MKQLLQISGTIGSIFIAVGLFTACTGVPFAAPEGVETATLTPATVQIIDTATAATNEINQSSFTSPVSTDAIVTQETAVPEATEEQLIITPTSVLVTVAPNSAVQQGTATPTPTGAISIIPLSPTPISTTQPITSLAPQIREPVLNMQVEAAKVETDATGQSYLSLPTTLNKTMVGPPVQEIVYLITNPLDNQLAETTIWRANVTDISNPTAIISFQHLSRYLGANNPTLSPNGNYLVYGQDTGDRARSQLIWLLDINDGTQQEIDKGMVIPSVNSPMFIWTTDSQSIIYSKTSEDWNSSEVYQYTLTEGETRTHLMEQGHISFVGRDGDKIYYLPLQISGPPYLVKVFDLDLNETKEVLTIEGQYVTSNIRMSPDGTRTLFNYLLVDLLTKTQARVTSASQVLWFPDGHGLLGGKPLSALHVNEVNQKSADTVTTPLKFPVNVDSDQFVAWSPDGQYLVYKVSSDSNQATYFLRDLLSGQTQQFPSAQLFQIGGWVSKK